MIRKILGFLFPQKSVLDELPEAKGSLYCSNCGAGPKEWTRAKFEEGKHWMYAGIESCNVCNPKMNDETLTYGPMGEAPNA